MNFKSETASKKKRKVCFYSLDILIFRLQIEFSMCAK